MSKRQDILDELQTVLETVNSLSSVIVKKPVFQDLDTVAMPVAFIYSGPSRLAIPEYQTIGYETFEWIVNIEIYGYEDLDLEDMLSSVHTTLFANNTLNDYAILSQITSTDMYDAMSSDRSFQGLIIEYNILYHHVQGQP